jgi:DUF1680 family protein
MITTLILPFIASVLGNPALAPTDGLDAIGFQQVEIRDRFWSQRQEINRKFSAPHSLDELAETGDLSNFTLAINGSHSGRKGYVFQDSDVYKVIEGAADTLATHPDPALDRRLDDIIALIGKAQMADGYIDTYYQVTEPGRRFTNLRDNHELYCAGHLIEAAVAHFLATGKRNLLSIAIKYADLLCVRYGPEGGRLGYGGHPELELALVKLSRATSDPRYFALAEKLVKTRGSHFFAKEHNTPDDEYDGTYWLDDVPITDHHEIKGHAVRAAYLMSGATDIVRQTGDPAIEKMLGRVWNNVIERRVFLTGGIGPSGSNEGFTVDYDLPNLSAYQETCASVAMAMWGYRMGLLHADAKYFDAVENALYNAMLAGVSLDGVRFFYVNPLASMGNHHRQAWFDCACCPPNVLRTVATIGGYAYAQKGSSLYVNLYLPGTVTWNLGGKPIKVDVRGDYPWDGKLQITPKVDAATQVSLHLRIPGWCQSASLKVNGKAIAQPAVEKGYFVVDRTWNRGDAVELDLPMPVDRVEANPLVKEDLGRLAVRRGPLIYCAEAVDQRAPIEELVLPREAKLNSEWRGNVLGGITTIVGTGERIEKEEWQKRLYQPVSHMSPTPVTLVPYCVWDNRQAGEMQVWLPTEPPAARVGGPESRAALSISYLSGNAQIEGVNDGVEPKSSGEGVTRLTHWWPHKGTEEWVGYQWKKPLTISGVKVYWFDDTGRGECRLPESWRLERLDGDKWVPIQLADYPIHKDQWCEVKFPPVQTSAMRLVVKLRPGWAAGVRQWKIEEAEE